MTAINTSNTITIISMQGETLDAVCWRYYGSSMEGTHMVETALQMNHGLADKGEVLPHGTTVILPTLSTTATRKETVQLWD